MADMDLFGEKNANTLPSKVNRTDIKVRTCPVCGTTDLQAMVIAMAIQNEEGVWSLEPVSDEDVTHEMSNVNNEVRCANTECGVPKDAQGMDINVPEGMSYQEFWLKENGYPSDTVFENLSEEEQEKYKTWESEIWFTPWSGTINECTLLEM